jgi:hypothetical protein
VRLTYDVDLVVQLAPENIKQAFAALAGIGFRPSVPVTGEQFADAAHGPVRFDSGIDCDEKTCKPSARHRRYRTPTNDHGSAG